MKHLHCVIICKAIALQWRWSNNMIKFILHGVGFCSDCLSGQFSQKPIPGVLVLPIHCNECKSCVNVFCSGRPVRLSTRLHQKGRKMQNHIFPPNYWPLDIYWWYLKLLTTIEERYKWQTANYQMKNTKGHLSHQTPNTKHQTPNTKWEMKIANTFYLGIVDLKGILRM